MRTWTGGDFGAYGVFWGVHGVWGGLCEAGKMLLWRCVRGAIPERCWGVLDDICCFGPLVKVWSFLVIEMGEMLKQFRVLRLYQ
ncbi:MULTISPECIES: hypothetical protein [unclassified Bartonella]|uniref:hypothetical protein n=1 Tax=unclassified Bartonella TaxID=2645622 RepID=UPI0035CF6249